MGLYYLFAGLAFLPVAAYFAFFAGKHEKVTPIVRKALTILLAAVATLRFLGTRHYEGFNLALGPTVGLNQHSPFGPDGGLSALLSVLALWLLCAAGIVLVLLPWFEKKISILWDVALCFILPVYLFAFGTLAIVPSALDGIAAAEAHEWREVLYAVEIGLGLGLTVGALLPRFLGREKIRMHAWWKILVSALGAILSSFPIYSVQVLYGLCKKPLTFTDFTPEHRVMLYGVVLLPILLHLALHKFDEEARRFALIVLALGTMISYSAYYALPDLADLSQWPLHLCNTAMYILPICLLFKLDKVYYFTLFINVLGTIFAMLMPNTSDGLNIFAASNLQFWINHYIAFFLPLLILSLRIFKRPKLKQFIFSAVCFAGYFLLVLFANAWLTTPTHVSDFFFINSDFITDKAGDWAEALRDKTATLTLFGKEMVFRPVYQILFYLTYNVLALAVWFVYEQFFEISDLYTEIIRRNQKIKADRLALEVALGGRSIKEPVNMDGVNSLILRDFSKKYSTSDVYAVSGANLVVNGGEIFGFLGPNGAGKSTIIKSIVGIQTLTSGAIEVCGFDVEKQSVEAKSQIGFVPDHYALYENLTGREYVNYIADLYGVSEEDRTERINDMVERFHLQGSFDNQMKTYSHGMKQKITIMSALVHEPKLWILDEPLTGLDPESIFQVKECMKNHAKKGNIVFFSSHIIDVVERICDRIAIIKKGNILCCKTVAEIEASGESLEHFYMKTIGEIPGEGESREPMEVAGNV